MAKFVRHIILFMLPLLLLAAVITIPVWESRELNPIIVNAKKQRDNHNCVIGLGYNEQTSYYKLLNANYYGAPIISLGTSRVMQFKNGFFSSEFYNCGGAVGGNYNEYKNFLENLNYTPEIVIVGLDAWVFNDAWNYNCAAYESFQTIDEVDRGAISLMKSIFMDWRSGKWKIADLNNYPGNVGFNGRVKDNGFMYDGSYYYGDIYRNPLSSEDYEFVDTYDRISTGTRRFEWGDHIDEDTLRQLENLLNYCKDNDIYVIGFSAPFAPSIYDRMMNSGNYRYIDEMNPACMEIFNDYGFEYFNYIDGESLDSTDEFFIDGFHGSEIVYAKILKDMASHNSIIAKYVDVDRIDESLNNAYSSYVIENPFTRVSLPN